MKMNFLDFIWGLKWDFLKKMLLQKWILPRDIEGVDFNNLNDLNALAERIMPDIIKSNPNVANMIKQNANLVGDKQKDVVEVIDAI